MKRYVVLVGVALVAAMTVTVHAGWMKTYGGLGTETGWFAQQTTDGGYIVLGNTSSNGRDIWLLKTDANGDTLWTKIYGTQAADWGNSAQQTVDGGYISAGYTQSFGAGNYDLWLLKTNSDGDTVWTRTYGGPDYDAATSVQQTEDGGYILTGYRDGKLNQQYHYVEEGDIWLLKTNAAGDTLWTKTYGTEELGEQGFCVRQTKDGGYIIACSGLYDSTTSDWARLMKTDASGDSVWTFRSSDKVFYCVQEVSDGGYVAAGNTAEAVSDVVLAKVDKDGKFLWEQRYGSPDNDWAEYISQTPDTGFIITGCYGAIMPINQNADLWLLKTDSKGDTLWTRLYGKNPQFDIGVSVCPTTDNGYIVCGQTQSYGAGGWDIWLIKTDSNGRVAVDEKPVFAKDRNWQIVSSIGQRIVFEYKDRPEGFHAAVFDESGRKVAGLNRTEPSGVITWGDGYSPGVYFICLQPENSASAQKVVLIK